LANNYINQTKLSQLQPKAVAAGTDQVVMYSNTSANDVLTPVSNLYTNTLLTAANLVIGQNNTPANSSANCLAGQIWADNYYLYFCPANNYIVRAALSPF
jgi:hypothetical protein